MNSHVCNIFSIIAWSLAENRTDESEIKLICCKNNAYRPCLIYIELNETKFRDKLMKLGVNMDVKKDVTRFSSLENSCKNLNILTFFFLFILRLYAVKSLFKIPTRRLSLYFIRVQICHITTLSPLLHTLYLLSRFGCNNCFRIKHGNEATGRLLGESPCRGMYFHERYFLKS